MCIDFRILGEVRVGDGLKTGVRMGSIDKIPLQSDGTVRMKREITLLGGVSLIVGLVSLNFLNNDLEE